METSHITPELIERCREFRHSPTTAEALLWTFLRAHRMEGYKFRRQHPVDRFILDFYCIDLRLAIEVDGGIHLEPEQESYDRFRTQTLKALGIRVLRFWNDDVIYNTDTVLEEIQIVVKHLGSNALHETPSP